MNSLPHIPSQLLAQLEDYYDGTLPAAEANQLRSQLGKDPDLAAAAAEWEAVYRHGLRPAPSTADAAALRERFAAIEAELPRPSAGTSATARRLPPRTLWLIAASVLLLIGLGWWLLRSSPPAEQLARNSFTWLPRQEATLGPAEDAQAGLLAYDRQDYATAYPLLLDGVAAGELDSINLLYAGVAALGADEAATAQTALLEVLDTERYPLAEPEIRYYLGLAYLQDGDTGAGTRVLQTVAQTDNPFAERAREVLQALSELQ